MGAENSGEIIKLEDATSVYKAEDVQDANQDANLEQKQPNSSTAVLLSQLEDYASAVMLNVNSKAKAIEAIDKNISSTDKNKPSSLLGSEKGKSPVGANDNSEKTNKFKTDPGPDPYSPDSLIELQKAIQKKLKELLAQMKANPFADITMGLSEVFQMVQSYGGNVVGADAESQQAMTGLTNVSSYIQQVLSEQPAKKGDKTVKNPDYYIDPNTGEKVKNDKGYTAEQCLEKAATYVHTSAMQKYKLDENGNPTKELNPLYEFFNAHSGKNKGLADNIQSNVESLITALGGDSGKMTIPDGAIAKMWNDANPPASKDPSKDPAPAPEPEVLQNVQTQMGNLAQSLTSSSSAVQALTKVDTQTYQAEQANNNKWFQTILTQNKTLIGNQKTS
ncbi:MAG: hypothetical protein S4CHLAM20_07450 [Chlamydiia bacterium]|nr:hypothetical protein [Chlamydiia bacterium]